MNLTGEEQRALGFVALLLALSAAVRVIDRPRPVQLDAAAVDVSALAAASRAAGERPAALGPGDRIDPNTAPLEELMRLPGIRKAVAESILRARAATPLRTMEDLDRVPGVGPVTLQRWQPHLRLSDAGSTSTEARPDRTGEARPVALNQATAAELETLPGIGPTLAARILAWRDSAGGFRDLDDLAKVRGIGPATLARLKPRLSL